VDRAERLGLGVSAGGHLLLLLALSLGILARPRKLPDMHAAMDVELVSAIAPTSMQKAQQPAAAPAPSPVEPAPAPPTAKPAAAPEPAPPKPKPEPKPVPPVLPKPEPKPVPKPEPKLVPKPEPKPVPKPKPVPEKPAPEKAKEKPKPEKPKPEVKPTAEAKPTAKPTPKASAKPAPRKPLDNTILNGLKAEKPAAASGKGATPSAKPKSHEGLEGLLNGISAQAKKETAAGPPAAKVSQLQLNGLSNLLRQQVQPCYNPISGGADVAKIVSVLSLKMKPDGSVASVTVVDHGGVTPDNSAYVRQMDDAAKRAVLRCAPFKLPAELYRGGWDDFDFRFKPEQMQ
jgi:hypothetical protein